jgi:hypothetical protein
MNAPAATLTPAMQPPVEVTKATQMANTLYTSAQAMVIDSPEGYQAAGEELVDLRARWKAIEAQRVHLKEPYLEGGRRIDAFFSVPLKRLEEAADMVKSRMLVFQRAEDDRVERERQERLRVEREEREALERAQREAAERERAAREESERLQREAQERAAEAQRAADAEAAAARAAGDEAAAAAAEAQAAEAQRIADQAAAAAREREQQEALAAQHHANEAQAAMDLADVAPPMPAVQSGARAQGVATRKTWKVKSVDKVQLVVAAAKAIDAGDQDKADQLLAYLLVDEAALNGVARSLKGAARVPGVVFGEVSNLATTGRR